MCFFKHCIVKFRPSFFVVAAFSVLFGLEEYFVTILLLVFLHELCHIFTAGLWGLKARSITFTAIGTIADIAGLEQLHITKRIIVAAAGPLFNILLCPFCRAPVLQINLIIAFFNLLPVYPLDGGKILHYILSYFTGVLRGNIVSVRISLFFGIIIAAAGMVQFVLYPPNLSLLCLGIYLYRFNKAGRINLTYNFYKTIVSKRENKIMPVRSMTTTARMELKAVVYRLGWDYYTLVYVREKGGIRQISEECIMRHIFAFGLRGSMGDIKN